MPAIFWGLGVAWFIIIEGGYYIYTKQKKIIKKIVCQYHYQQTIFKIKINKNYLVLS